MFTQHLYLVSVDVNISFIAGLGPVIKRTENALQRWFQFPLINFYKLRYPSDSDYLVYFVVKNMNNRLQSIDILDYSLRFLHFLKKKGLAAVHTMKGGHNIVVTVQITELTTQENSLKKKTIKK